MAPPSGIRTVPAHPGARANGRVTADARTPHLGRTAGISLEQLTYLAAVVDEGSFHRAADVLNLAQPSLSRAIANLEKQLKCTLLHRTNSGVRTTAIGELVMPYVRSVLRSVESLVGECSSQVNLDAGAVRLGAIAVATQLWLPWVLSQLASTHPGIQVTVHEGGSKQISGFVAEGRYDFGIVSFFGERPRPSEGVLCLEEIARDRLVACVPATHPLAAKPALVAEDLVDEPLITYSEGFVVSETLSETFGSHHPIALRTDNTETAKCMVAAGVGVAFIGELGREVDAHAQRGEVVYRRVEGIPSDVRICAVRPRAVPLSPAARYCLDLIRRAARSHGRRLPPPTT
jgi:DNA-binding transcriptional LysR family regulator